MTKPFTPPYAANPTDTCPECHGSFEVDADGMYVSHRIAYDGEPCSDEATATGNRDSLTAAEPTIADRVARGVTLLDARRPDWYRQIAAEFLDLQSCSECVLGQLFGSFHVGATILGVGRDADQESEADYGFDITGREPGESYDELHAEWLRVVSERVAVAR